ncbi:MAG: protein-disulfide reductase DsbD [Steroidobacteraceae bacterium]
MRAFVRLCALFVLPLAGAATALAVQAAGLDQILGRVQSNAGQFLPADRVFRLFAEPLDARHIRLSWEIAPGYYLYRDTLKATTSSAAAKVGPLDLPAGLRKTDDLGTHQVFRNQVVALLPVERASAGAPLTVPVQVTYRGCADAGLCYPPITKTLPISLPALGGYGGSAGAAGTATPAAPSSGAVLKAGGGGASSAVASDAVGPAAAPYVSAQDRYASVVRSGSLAGIVAFFYVAGLVLAFTPCVLPMVPIVSGIIAGGADRGGEGWMRGFSLSFVYVIGMALTYTAAGIAVAAGGQHVQAVFQQPWIITAFAALFVALALSMFGVFTLQMPAAIQTRLAGLSGRQSAGTVGGVFVMGALSALIVTTCVAPALVGALVVIGQSGDMFRGGLALFVMGLGMGTPLLAVGASAGRLLPKAGAWMDIVKRLFGALMLAVAAWMLARIVPARFTLLLWAVPAAAAAVVLWNGATALSGGRLAIRLAASLAGVYVLALLAGIALGGTDPLAPWSGARHEPAFRTIKSVADLNREVAAAHDAGRPVMLDFYADWCVSCKEMEKYTFTSPAVQGALGDAILLRADVTQNDAADQALLGHFGIYGPPTIAFYGPDGSERRRYRVVGYVKARDFASIVHLAFAPTAASAAVRPFRGVADAPAAVAASR